MSAAGHVTREIFTFSRLAEFCTLRELEKQTGHDANDWPIYIVKELVDNALDAAEEAEIAPQVEVEFGNNRIVVADNARGIAAETAKRLLDLGSRTSARARYVSPSRGAQGQALSTILVMPHALDPAGNGAVIIEAHGIAHRISVHVDKLSEEPRLLHERAASSVKNGTRITIEWPQSASTILADNEEQILPLLSAYALANPHLGLTLRRPDNDPEVWSTIDPDWQKWRTCDPTSAHWYRPEDFARLVAAYIQQDQAADRRRPLREFLALFDGLASTTRRGKILTEIGLTRAVLADLLCDGAPDRRAIDALLRAMRAETKPVKPARLGSIGETNLRRRLSAFGDADSFRYARAIGFDHEGLPYIVEGAFVWTPNQSRRRLIVGANFASAPSLSISLGPFETVGTLLAQRHAGQDEPVVVLLHVVQPRPTFTNLGKTQLSPPPGVVSDLHKVVEKITAEWHKQRQREERDRRAVIKRRDAFFRSQKTTAKDVVRRHLPAVYDKVSGGLGARCRQLFYGLRPHILAETDRDDIDDAYIMYTLIPGFIAENPVLWGDWIVFFDDRGHLLEPHTKKVVGLGTRNVREYCRGWQTPIISGFELAPPQIGTSGPSGRYGAILFTEKEGFNELFQAVGLPERFDVCLASTKGTSVTAARELFELAGRHGVPIFALHDFDYNGFEIAATLRRDTRRYQFDHPPEIIDIGLRLADIERLDLQSEPVVFGNRNPAALRKNLRLNGATESEIAYLVDSKQRVELNAMTSPQLIELIEDALVANGVGKVIPNASTLAAAFRSRVEYMRAQKAVGQAIVAARRRAGEIAIPDDLAERVAAYLKAHPSVPWENAVRAIANGAARRPAK